MTLADNDTNSIITDDANTLGKLELKVIIKTVVGWYGDAQCEL